MQSCKKPGCTDPNATNYNPSANTDDFSCEYDSVSTFELIWEVNHMFRNDSFSYFTNFYDDSNLKTSYLSKLKLINEQNKEFLLYAYSDTISEDYVVTSSENSNNYFRLKDKEEYSKIFFEN